MDLSHEERIAALLDGKYGDAERERLLAELVASDDDMETLAAVAAALREYEEEERAEGVTPLHAPIAETAPGRAPERPRWKPPRWAYGLAAAAALTAIIVPRLGTEATDPGGVAALLTRPDAGAPPGFQTVARGTPRDAPGTRLSERDRVQLGVYLADLEVLARSRSDSAGKVAGRVADLLATDPAGAGLAGRYRQIAGPGGRTAPLPDALGRDATRFGGRPAELGIWLETARVAASREDAAFFRGRLSRKVARGKGPGELLRRASPETVRELGEARVSGASPDWSRLRSALDSVLRKLVA